MWKKEWKKEGKVSHASFARWQRNATAFTKMSLDLLRRATKFVVFTRLGDFFCENQERLNNQTLVGTCVKEPFSRLLTSPLELDPPSDSFDDEALLPFAPLPLAFSFNV